MSNKYVKEDEVFLTSRNGVVPKPTASDVSNNKVLRADGSWVTQSGGGGSSSLSGLDDVNLISPTNGQLLQYDSTSHKWVNAKPMHNYSTSEQVVGTWIDGKPIYEKTIYCNIYAGGSQNTAHNISSLDCIVSIQAITTSGGGSDNEYRPIPFAYATSSSNSAWYAGITVNNTNIKIEAGTSFGNRHSDAYVTIRYTKTTDV